MYALQVVSTASASNRPEEGIFFSESDASALVKEPVLESPSAYIALVTAGVYGRGSYPIAISRPMSYEWREEIGASTVRALDFEISQLEAIYEFLNPFEVRGYFLDYPFLIELLFEAFPEIERFFGRNPRVVLKVVKDPDIEGEEQLFAYIHTALSAEEALNRMDRLDEEWFLDKIDYTEGKFNLNIEFV